MKGKNRKQGKSAQVLEPLTTSRCVKCGKLVKWRVKTTYKCADGRHQILYLYCPTKGCDGRARQIADIT